MGRAVVGVVLGLLLTAALARPALAAGETGDALVRVAWFVQGSTAGDVYVDGVKSAGPLPFRSVSGYQRLQPGNHNFEFRPAGSPAGTTPIATRSTLMAAGSSYTVAATGGAQPVTVLTDDFGSAPAGTALLRVAHLAPSAPPLDAAFKNGQILVRHLSFQQATSYQVVNAADYTLELRESTSHSLLGSEALSAKAGSAQTVFIAGGVGQQPLQMITVSDVALASGSGPPPTGAGGTALPAIGALLVMAASGTLLLRAAASQKNRVTAGTALLGLCGCLLLATPAIESAWSGVSSSGGQGRSDQLPLRFLRPPQLNAAPTRLEIPRIGVDAPMVRLGRNPDATIETPRDPSEAGWYADSPVPGAIGPAVITGHLDSTAGPAVFWRLAQLHAGDVVGVKQSNGTNVWFAITSVARYPRSAFPDGAVYGPSRQAELRLITCVGAFDTTTRQYSQNLVVYAVRVT